MNLLQFKNIDFKLDSPISWNCPYCNNSSLIVTKEKFFSEYSKETNENHDKEYWDFEWDTYNFSGILFCKTCSNHTMFTGTGKLEHYGYYDYTLEKYEEGYHIIYTPIFFHPPLNLFIIPKNCPDIVKEEIIISFGLLWYDLPSCANKIRVSIEILLDTLKVKKYQIVKKKRNQLSLHKRIQEYKSKNFDIANHLEAIKWIGNAGSHTNRLGRQDILEAFQLLEYSLRKLYINEEKQILKLTKEINSRKGTRKNL